MTTSTDKINWGAPFETIPPDEAKEIDEVGAIGKVLQDKRAQAVKNQEGKLLRGVHAKSHGCVKAEFKINDDIEELYCVGLFAHPGKTHEAWIRFSNAAVLRENDLKKNRDGVRQNGSRGMAIKVLDVAGVILSKDNGQQNQDFLMINTPEFAFANVRDYLRLNKILDLDDLGADPGAYFIPALLAKLGKPEDGEPATKAGKRKALQAIMESNPLINNLTPDDRNGTFSSAGIAAKISGEIVRNPMQVQYFGAAPFLFGDGRVMKFSAAPCPATVQIPFDPITADDPTEDYLRAALRQSMEGEQDLHFDFKVQVRNVDDSGLNIEDATTTWPDEAAKYVPVARVTIKVPQSPFTPEAIAHCEQLAFSPWHALTAHQPLGGINRLRRKVYSESARHRSACGY